MSDVVSQTVAAVRRNLSESQTTPNARPRSTVAIVGTGFCGTLTLANLIDQAQEPLTIYIFEKEPRRFMTGLAYATEEKRHLLNVRADKMGAFHGKPEDFFHWLQTPPGIAAAAKSGVTLPVRPDAFVPRAVYGSYLKNVFALSLKAATRKGIDVKIVYAEVTDARPHNADAQTLQLTFSQNNHEKKMIVNALVLATGNRAPRGINVPGLAPQADPTQPIRVWSKTADGKPAGDTLILGTGLTMVDAALSLNAQNYAGRITALSRHGRLPQPHQPAQPYPAWEWTRAPETIPHTAEGLRDRFLQEVEQAVRDGYDWRSVVDSVRPIMPMIWQGLSDAEKEIFYARLRPLWNVHRHRAPAAALTRLEDLHRDGRLKIAAGEIVAIQPHADNFTVTYRERDTGETLCLVVSQILDCTGPDYVVTSAEEPLFKNLLGRDLARPGPLALGLAVDAFGKVKSDQALIFALGALAVGEQFESTAVPELRFQAFVVSLGLLSSFKAKDAVANTSVAEPPALF